MKLNKTFVLLTPLIPLIGCDSDSTEHTDARGIDSGHDSSVMYDVRTDSTAAKADAPLTPDAGVTIDAGAGSDAQPLLPRAALFSAGPRASVRMDLGKVANVNVFGESIADWRVWANDALLPLVDAAVLALRQRDGSVHQYIQVHAAVALGAVMRAEHVPTGTTWKAIAEARPSLVYRLHPIELVDADGKGGGPAGFMDGLRGVTSLLAERCAITFDIVAPVKAAVAEPDRLLDGILEVPDVPDYALVVPAQLKSLVPPDARNELNLVFHPRAINQALTPGLYEIYRGPTVQALFWPRLPIQTYDIDVDTGDAEELWAKSKATQDPAYRMAYTNLEDLDGKVKNLVALHEIGHMLALSHPNYTASKDDDFDDNWMEPGGSGFPRSSSAAGFHVSARQCLIAGLDLNGFAKTN